MLDGVLVVGAVPPARHRAPAGRDCSHAEMDARSGIRSAYAIAEALGGVDLLLGLRHTSLRGEPARAALRLPTVGRTASLRFGRPVRQARAGQARAAAAG